MLVDVGRRQILDILPSRTKVNVAAYLGDLPDKGNVQVVVAGMWRGYHVLSDEFFPGRLVVVDKFHVVRMAHNGLDAVRKAIGRTRVGGAAAPARGRAIPSSKAGPRPRRRRAHQGQRLAAGLPAPAEGLRRQGAVHRRLRRPDWILG